MPSAGELLGRAGLPLMSVRAALTSVDPEAVPVREAPRWLRALWRREVAAMALPWAIYLRPVVFRWSPERLRRLLVHELVHVDQWKRLGVVRFLGRYLGEYLRGLIAFRSHTRAYRDISLEREAEDTAAALAG